LPNERPNILLIMSDEHNPAYAEPYGHPFVRTPNLQRLAREGVVFDSFSCNSPLCVPSRMSFMTGRYASQVGSFDLGCTLSSDHPTWAHLLASAGYDTALCGKMHFNGTDQLHSFRRRPIEDVTGAGTPDVFPNWSDAKGVWPFRELILQGGHVDDGTAYKKGSVAYDRRVHEHAVQYLEQYAVSSREHPFCLVAGYYAPHWPYACEQRYWNLYWPDYADLPRHPMPPEHPVYRRLQEMAGLDETIDDMQIRRCRAAYYGLVTSLDDHIGGLLDTMDRLGLAEDTVVIYTSDHGEMLGERGLWGKEVLLEGANRVPFIARWPGHFPSARRVSAVASLVDLTATLLDLSGTEPPPWVEGASILPLLCGDDVPWKGQAFSEYLAHGVIHPQCSLRRGRYKLNLFAGEGCELYDLHDDPDELHDLALVSEYRPVVADLTAAIPPWWNATSLESLILESQALRRCTRAGSHALAKSL